MDREHFDALTRLFAKRGSRRATLTALVGTVLFGLDTQTITAAKGIEAEHRRHRRRRRKKNKNRGCNGIGQYPKPRRRCCPGLVVDVDGRCVSRRCGSCPPCQRCSGGSCVANLAHNGRCCPGGICATGVCTACPAGQRCHNNQCRCDRQSCPGGCCTALGTSAGTCQSGTAPETCGSVGRICAVCSGATPTCTGGVCVCDALTASCGTGCCNGTSCQVGTADTVCGANGAACGSCDPGRTCEPVAGGGACSL